jgi:hypothetical protein
VPYADIGIGHICCGTRNTRSSAAIRCSARRSAGCCCASRRSFTAAVDQWPVSSGFFASDRCDFWASKRSRATSGVGFGSQPGGFGLSRWNAKSA